MITESKVTDLMKWKMDHAPKINEALKWSEVTEQVVSSNLRIMFAWQRVMLRSMRL